MNIANLAIPLYSHRLRGLNETYYIIALYDIVTAAIHNQT